MRTLFVVAAFAVVAVIAGVGTPVAAQSGVWSLRPLGIEETKQEIVDFNGDVLLLRGDVELTIGKATIYADEAEHRTNVDELQLRGNVRVTTPQYRGDVRIVVGTGGTVILADEAEYDRTAKDFTLQGNVRVQKTPPPK